MNRNPGVTAGQKHLEICADARIGIAHFAERRSVPDSIVNCPFFLRRSFVVEKHALPGALCVQRTSIKQGTRGSLGIRPGEKIQLLLCPIELPGKQQQLEQERTALGVEWIGSQLIAKRLDGLPQSSFAVKR